MPVGREYATSINGVFTKFILYTRVKAHQVLSNGTLNFLVNNARTFYNKFSTEAVSQFLIVLIKGGRE